jgi:pimeloyl-ACP methyl ester carboxylesterase
MPTIKVNGNISLFYESAGTGLPVVFLHGVLGSSEYFLFQKKHPIKGAASIFLDFRGHGKSQASHFGHSVSQYAWDVHETLNKLGISRFILVGWSMGALVAWEYIHIFGEKNVAGLVIVDQSPSDFSFKGWPFGTITLKGLKEIQNGLFENQHKLAEENARNIFHQPSDENLSRSVAEFLKVDPNSAHSIFTDQTFRDYRQIALVVSCPVLLCFGRHSSMVPCQAGMYLHKHLQDSELVIFEHSSHCPFIEEDEKFNRVVEAFVKKCS